MQGDLISKSELLESLNDWIDENTDIKTILRWIEEYETAYDVEKVVAELNDYYEEKLVIVTPQARERVEEIVRNGGKE